MNNLISYTAAILAVIGAFGAAASLSQWYGTQESHIRTACLFFLVFLASMLVFAALKFN